MRELILNDGDAQNMKIEKENKDNSDIATARILARRLDKISKGGCGICNQRGYA